MAGIPIRVLVVDDEPVVGMSLVEYLDDHGFEATSVENARDAMDLLAKVRYDLAIVDLRLSGVSGEGLILQAQKLHPSLRFLIHTGSISYRPSKELELIGIQAEHVFIKPLPDLKLFIKTIKSLVAGKEDDDVR